MFYISSVFCNSLFTDSLTVFSTLFCIIFIDSSKLGFGNNGVDDNFTVN